VRTWNGIGAHPAGCQWSSRLPNRLPKVSTELSWDEVPRTRFGSRPVRTMPEQKFTGEEKGGFPRLQKSSALSLHHRIVIAFRSPRGIVETGLLICPAEKKPQCSPPLLRRTLPPDRFENENSQFSGIWRDSQAHRRRNPVHFRLRGGEQDIRTRVLTPSQTN
jgi:hypothetical protein